MSASLMSARARLMSGRARRLSVLAAGGALAAACAGPVAARPGGPDPVTSLPATTSASPPKSPSASASGPAAAPVVAAAGDISTRCTGKGCGARATSDLALALDPDAVLALGDLQYPSGALRDFRAYYDVTWGRFKDRTRPAPGNHEYRTPGAKGYFRYWGRAARPRGRSWYGFDLGAWRLISLDSTAPHGPGSAQAAWLESELAAHPRRCVLAYWHHPRFSSGRAHGGDPSVGTFWKALYAARADVVLAGHEHNYERFAALRPDGEPSGDGLRQFVAGTGGASHYPFGPPVTGSEFRDAAHFGVLRLVLRPGGYDWRFVGSGGRVLDSGGGRCV
ncbi:hypothetical protein BJ981_005283 [Sphaerisporangium krabiense]|uniref:Calcineurin-like phosphoesterase domain-containing protein n=2 Tax=Sphaerisporangium krabiense TaxID=763782 RepID=A0A7W8Z8W8_9ACTN|nr:hypothetical protein [Sphaerisporangium krabiense]